MFPDAPVKASVLTLTNASATPAAPEPVRLQRVAARPAAAGRASARWSPAATRPPAPSSRATPGSTEYASRVAFAWCSEPVAIDDRRPHRVPRPQRLAVGARPAWRSMRCPTGSAPGSTRARRCTAALTLAPGETRRVVFLLGEGTSVDDVHALIGRCGDVQRVQEGRTPARCARGKTCSAPSRSARPTTRST